MGYKGTIGKTNWTLGEISSRSFGRFDADKPIYKNGAGILENWLVTKAGGITFRPGTTYAGEIKDMSLKVRFERFRYSTSQEYVLEIGNLYMRFWADGGQVVVGFVPVEIVTPFLTADLFQLEMANNADVMYITHPSYYPQKLVRTSATSFTITDVPFVRGPLLDDNITATTITPSADTGAGITITASTPIFQAGHVKSLWRVKDGVVKITGFTSTTILVGNVQAEPDGTAGNLNTGGPSAVTDWAEGAFSGVRGYPTAVTFHDQRLVYGGTTYQPQTFYASVIGAYDNFDKGSSADADAYIYQIGSNVVNDIRWMSSDIDLKFGTGGGTVTAKAQGVTGITPTSPPQIIIDTDYSVQHSMPERIGGYLFYIESSSFGLRQLIFDLIQNRNKSDDMTVLSDHIFRDGGGVVQIARQQSPTDRIWAVRNDGQIAVFTRNPEQQVLAWCRFLLGTSAKGPGVVETIAILPQDGGDDIVWCVVKRNIGGSTVRYVEYFSITEIFTYDWEPVRLDCSLSYNTPMDISGVTNANPCVITAIAHGFNNGDQIKIDNITTYLINDVTYGMGDLNTNVYLVSNKTADTFEITDLDGNLIDSTSFGTYIDGGEVRKMNTTFAGLSHLEGETVSVTADGALPSAQQTYVVTTGQISLIVPAAVVHIGLPYIGTAQFLPLSGDGQTVNITKERKPYDVNFKVWKSLGGKFGKTLDKLYYIVMPNQSSNLEAYHSNPAYTGDIIDVDFESEVDTDWAPFLVQDEPLPFTLLAAIIRSEVFEDK